MSADQPSNPSNPDNPGKPSQPRDTSKVTATNPASPLQEKSLQSMEALLRQSAQGIHVLFDNSDIASALSKSYDEKDFFDFQKMKRVQDVMTDLIAKPTYYEKISFLRDLDTDSYHMLIRTYFHIVENTVRSSSDHPH